MRQHLSGIGLYFLLATSVVAQSTNETDEAKSLLRSMEFERGRLRSGVVRLRGIRSSFHPEESESSYQTPVDLDCAFDWDAGMVRYDSRRIRPTAFFSGAEVSAAANLSETLDDRESELCTTWLRTVRRPDLFAFYEKITGPKPEERIESDTGVEIYPCASPAGKALLGPNHCFDVRSVNLFNYWEFCGDTYLMGYELPEDHWHLCDLDVSISCLLNWPVLAVERDGQLTTIRFQGNMTVTLDEDRGFTPVAYFDHRGEEVPDYIGDICSSSAKWEPIGDVWVPTDFMIEILNGYGEGHSLRHTYTLEWSRVNQPIPEHYFDFRDFEGVQEDAVVYDSRTQEGVPIGSWQNGVFVPRTTPAPSAPVQLMETPRQFRPRLLIINGVVLIMLLTGWLLFRMGRSSAG